MTFDLDADRRLWLPGRRRFFLLGLAAGVGAMLPKPALLPGPGWWIHEARFSNISAIVLPHDMPGGVLRGVICVGHQGCEVRPTSVREGYVEAYAGGLVVRPQDAPPLGRPLPERQP